MEAHSVLLLTNPALLQSMEDRVAFVKEMHLLKTDLFMNLIEQGQLPLRPGVTRVISMFPTQRCFSLI